MKATQIIKALGDRAMQEVDEHMSDTIDFQIADAVIDVVSEYEEEVKETGLNPEIKLYDLVAEIIRTYESNMEYHRKRIQKEKRNK